MNFMINEAFALTGRMLDKIKSFLLSQGLRYEGDAEYTLYLTNDSGEIMGTGSLAGSVLKYIAVSEALRGRGEASRIVSGLVKYAYLHGRKKLFLFTRPQNEHFFRGVGFFPVAETRDAVYMENSRGGFQDYLNSLEKGSGVQGAVIVSCDPFTLGHKSFFERSAALCDTLHGFIVNESASEFPRDVRFRLAREGTRHIKNLILHESEGYPMSCSAFPSYFINNEADIPKVNTVLELVLFYSRIAPTLNITVRFAEAEARLPAKKTYNERMKALLPLHGIAVHEIESCGDISAAAIRKAVRAGDAGTVKRLVPETTSDYIMKHCF